MTRPPYRSALSIAVLTLAAVGAHANDSKQGPITVNLDLAPRALDMDAMRKNMMGYMPSGDTLVAERPAGITKEPAYKGKPKYGALRIGNGPKSITYLAIDEVAGENGRVFVDTNQNGDLTDDGAPTWDEAKVYDGVLAYQKVITLHASWGTPVHEEEAGSYTLLIYKRHGDDNLGWTKYTARSGKLKLGTKTYPILLAENGSDGIFTVAKSRDLTRRPVQLLIDLDGDGLFKGTTTTVKGKQVRSPESFMIDQPFQIAGTWWEAFPTISGSELTFSPSAAPGTPAPTQAPVEQKPLLTAGTSAPDFTAATPEGNPIHLSDFKGKIVLLDFWATWCGPCQESMPGLQKIYDQVRSQGVVVLSLNVWDAKDPFDAWIAKNSGKTYNFTFAFDKAGRDKSSIAKAKYNVSGIPTMYIIGRDGKIKSSVVGSGNETEIVKALGALGIKATAK